MAQCRPDSDCSRRAEAGILYAPPHEALARGPDTDRATDQLVIFSARRTADLPPRGTIPILLPELAGLHSRLARPHRHPAAHVRDLQQETGTAAADSHLSAVPRGGTGRFRQSWCLAEAIASLSASDNSLRNEAMFETAPCRSPLKSTWPSRVACSSSVRSWRAATTGSVPNATSRRLTKSAPRR